jgi:hypothetical protein
MKEAVSGIIRHTTQEVENTGTFFGIMDGGYLQLKEADYVW